MVFLFTFLKVFFEFLREEQSSKLIMGNVRRLRHINLSLLDFQGNEHVIDISKCDYIVNRWIGIEESLCDMLLNELILTILMTCLFSNDNLVARS